MLFYPNDISSFRRRAQINSAQEIQPNYNQQDNQYEGIDRSYVNMTGEGKLMCHSILIS